MLKIIKKIILLYILLILLFSCKKNNYTLVEKKISDELNVKEIIKDTFLIIHSFPWPGNSLLVRLNQKNFIWIDTPYTPEATSIILDWIYTKFSKNINITEINTGFHIDNLGGNEELTKRNIPIYGSQLTCKLLKTKSKITMNKMLKWLSSQDNKKYYDTYNNFKFYEPTNVFNINNEQKIKFGKENIEIYYPGPTHTYDNLIVYIPSKKLIFGGCMVLSLDAKKAGYIDDGNIKEWPDSLKKILKKYKNAEIVVPGHGNPGDLSLIEHTINIIYIKLNLS